MYLRSSTKVYVGHACKHALSAAYHLHIANFTLRLAPGLSKYIGYQSFHALDNRVRNCNVTNVIQSSLDWMTLVTIQYVRQFVRHAQLAFKARK